LVLLFPGTGKSGISQKTRRRNKSAPQQAGAYIEPVQRVKDSCHYMADFADGGEAELKPANIVNVFHCRPR